MRAARTVEIFHARGGRGVSASRACRRDPGDHDRLPRDGLNCDVRAANRGRIGNSDVSEEAVSATSNGFDEAGTLGGVAEGLTNFVDRLVEPVVEIHECVRGPEFLLKFLATDDLAGVLEQHRQNLEGLLLKPDSQAALAQFASAKIHLENPKTEPPARLMVRFHAEVNLSLKRTTRPTDRWKGTASCKSSVKCVLPGDLRSSGAGTVPSISRIGRASHSDDGIHPAPTGGVRGWNQEGKQTRRTRMSEKQKDELLHDHNDDGVDRRGFLKCMAWAGTGAFFVMQGGVLKSYSLSRIAELGTQVGRVS